MNEEALAGTPAQNPDADMKIIPDRPEPEREQKPEPMPAPNDHIAAVNTANAAESTGRVNDDGGTTAFFTAAQVRAMTPAQVRVNYSRIVESMKCKSFFE